jgi:hypothetical protein
MVALALTLAVVAQSNPFPLPAIDGKPLAVTEKQKSFRLPMRFEKVRAFYEEQFAKEKDLSLKVAGVSGQRTLTLTTKRLSDGWTKAIVKEGELETVVDVTPVITLRPTEVNGNGKPLVQFVFERSKEVDKAVNGIDHMEK